MKIKVAAGYLAFLAVLIGSCQKNTATSSSGSRSFYMGTTPWPANFTPADQDTAYQFINNHCDIVSHHFDDGIPYYEAFNNLSMPAAFLQDLQTRQSKTAVGKQILLSVAPLNGTRIAKAAYYAGDSISDSTKNYWLQLRWLLN
jgi:hypothetical protein